MRKIPVKYDPTIIEDKWYSYWMENKFFHSEPDEREPYTIVIPPPNVTGVLHMGHMLNNTIQDVLVRRARMLGKNGCWVPGTDHASIATEAKVVDKLLKEGITKDDLTRDQFLEHAWAWTHKHGGIILEQLKKLGASCDWERTAFTMDEIRSASVIRTFVDLYNKGYVYRGVRMVNWDPAAKTAVSDEEVIYREEQSKLYYVRYLVEGTTDQYITVATTRPETILGDTAVCVNPADKRFTHLVGKRVLVPLVKRSIPVIQDEYVEMDFGTGCLKITPAHDTNDYEIGIRHNLEVIDTFNDDGTLSEKAQLLVGVDRFEARKQIVPMLEAAENLVKIEDYNNKVGYSERTHVPIEPKLSAQWFLKMGDLAKPALEAVETDAIRFYPSKFKNLYRHWMENIKDWCISRQLWWGHRIPVYYLPDGSFVVAETEAKALELAKAKTGNPALTLDSLRQDEDVLDTWASSWLWPISVFENADPTDTCDLDYYYPTNDLVTAPEIIFFWVARMVIAGYEYKGTLPFKNVYFTGIVRDKLRRKMSKSLGNSPDPLDLIAKYGADGVRVGMLLCSPAGNDILFDESLTDQGRGFLTKVWNSFRLINGWEIDTAIPQPEHSRLGIEWFRAKLNEAILTMDDHFDKYRLNDALLTIHATIRDEFSGWLLEIIKPAYQQPIDAKTYTEVNELLDKLLKLLHPFMPFISEEIWQLIGDRKQGESIMMVSWPKASGKNDALTERFELVKEVVSGIRSIRKEKNIATREEIELFIIPGEKGYVPEFIEVVSKLGNVTRLETCSEEIPGAATFMVKSSAFYIPFAGNVDVEAEVAKINEELAYNRGFLESVIRKLSNEKFVGSAPAKVVEMERKKQADAEEKIKILEERLAAIR
ncbi:MAG: valine--tRNA ligase [Prolixibacteraceae bacterium]|nr:valine--tRNA ligase [Prolixibacteraceae bacterium]